MAKAGSDAIAVNIMRQEEQKNCPAPDSYTVTLYQNGTQIASHTLDAKNQATILSGGNGTENQGMLQTAFDGLDSEATYTVRICAESPVGRSDTAVLTVTTLETETETETEQESETESESETGAPGETETETEQESETESESETGAPVETETETEQESETESESETVAPIETETETEQESETENESETTAPVETETQKQTQKTTEVPKNGTTNGGNTPETEDDTNIWLWLFLLAASGILLSGEALQHRKAGKRK